MDNCLDKIEPIPVVCRQSTLACALSCPRKWWYKYRMGITLRGVELKRAATLGTLYHRLQCLGPGSEGTVKAEVQKEQTALMDRANKGEDLDGNMARQAGMLTELYHKAVVMSHIFWERYPPNPGLETIGREVHIQHQPSFHNCPPNCPPMEGTVDLILRDLDGSVWIRDFKSTGRSLETIFGGLAWSLQARIYRVLVASHMGLPVKGFILDGILTPGIKLCRTDENNAKNWNVPVEEAYLNRVRVWYKEKKEESIRSRGIIYTEELWPEELIDVMNFFHYLTTDNDPRKPEGYGRDTTRRECFAWEKQCIYYDLCNMSSQYWDGLFETKFQFMERDKSETEDETVAVPDSDVG